MGRLMGSSNSNNYGEQIFINKASEYLDDTNIIYWNRQLFGKEFDVCILMPEKGILVVELKGWREENILRIENNDSVIIQTNDGEVSASPQKQARGYRFSIERHIRQNISKFPLVYQMVCLPQVSKAFFKSHRLDVVMEEKFTILKEDLKDNTSFFNKLDQALREVCHWNRDPFDRRTMLEVRNLFETDINVDEDGESEIEKELASSYHRHDYSRFYYFNEFDQMSGNTINDMVAQYLHGCKLYCVFSKKAQMKFDYSQMNYAPDKQLRAYEFQHPTWFINHLKVSKNLHLVNNATYGFRVLAGCRAFLLPHQISTVARCFETTPVRYMLADEVGLGKTVEACSVLSILASENKDLRVLIVVPGALASQWKNELHYKYGLNADINSPRSRICLLSMEDIGKSLLTLSTPWDLAIVDETHRLLANDAWYNQVQSLSRRVKHILLLSATPIQDRNEEYRRLLALLNPEQYENMSAERFAWMVKRQKRIQKSANLLLGYLERCVDLFAATRPFTNTRLSHAGFVFLQSIIDSFSR